MSYQPVHRLSCWRLEPVGTLEAISVYFASSFPLIKKCAFIVIGHDSQAAVIAHLQVQACSSPFLGNPLPDE